MASDIQPIWQATVSLGDDGPAAAFADFLEQDSVGVSVFEAEPDGWTITALYRGRPDQARLEVGLALIAAAEDGPEPRLELAPLPVADWLAEAYAGFPARRIGRFYVHGSHIAGPPPGGLIPLKIDAAIAFGSGEHATTEGCLLALADRRRRRPRIGRVLDMGTGSGILAIAAAKLWPMAQTVAIDIDADSARVAAANARLNRVGPRIRARHGDGYRSPLAAKGRRFDLIVSNILARPLVRMAPSLARRLAPGGAAVLSGLLARQERGVLAAYRAAGLKLVARRRIAGWSTLMLARPRSDDQS
ncbi:MAG TPA: 50S ribosomal protein L11 methyltransferase [Alphaproteobacteria bacterium]|nr:50S ribosomal protein L11 methyltransferase [Alphaproteobacteria bacterium]